MPSGFATQQRSASVFADTIAQKDSGVVSRIRAAGAIIIGKKQHGPNSVLGHDVQSVLRCNATPHRSVPLCWRPHRGGGGALACGMLTVADGSDMMGQPAQPAAWNNVYGMRQSWGTVSGKPEGDMFPASAQHGRTMGVPRVIWQPCWIP